MSYARRCLAKATSETRQYWTGPQIFATVAAGPVAGVLWTIFKPWAGWAAVMQIALISIGMFFALWGLLFFGNLLNAPRELDAEKQQEYARLQARQQEAVEELARLKERDPAEESRLAFVADKLGTCSLEGLKFLAWLHTHGETEEPYFRNSGRSQSDINEALSVGQQSQIVKSRPINRAGSRVYRISPELDHAVVTFLAAKGVLYGPAVPPGA